MKLFRKLTKREWKEIGEKYKNGGVHMYRDKLTYFYNGEKLWDDEGNENLVYDWKERQSWKVIIVLPGVEIIPDHTFKGCSNVETVIMSDSVKRIERMAFYRCRSLEFVRFSKNIEFIGEFAFSDCLSLTSIFIPESCREIDRHAFDGCEKLIILNVPRTTKLGLIVIEKTALIFNSPFGDSRGFYYKDNDKVNEWIKTRHNNLPLHKLCCSEDPKFNQNTIIPTKQECLTQDDLGWTPFIYLMANHTAEYDAIEQMIKIGGKELLFIEDKKGMNSLHYACLMGNEAVVRLLVRKGGRELVDTLKSEGIDAYEDLMTSALGNIDASEHLIKSALLLHDYIYAIENTNSNVNLDEMDEMIDTILESKPSFREITEIMGIQGIPDKQRQEFQEYNQSLLDQELKSLSENQEKVPLMRSTITVVGRGRDGKTSTINSLKGLPFEPYCESTKGSQTSEIDVHEIGIHVTNVEASDVAFDEAERDPFSTTRSLSSHLMNKDGEPGRYDNFVENASSDSTTPNESDSVDSINKRLVKQTLESNVSIEKESRLEEEIATKVDNINLPTNKDGKSIRFTIYDNGGQRVFRSIQNLLLSREGIFIVVFDIMKIFDENSRHEALEHLLYWLSSIKMDACEADSDEYTDPSIKYPPIIIVGTHYDEFLKLKGDPFKGLQILNKILVDILPLSDLVQVSCQSNDSVPRDRQQLYNEAQDLCFWPVDNSNPNDTNIRAIRRILLETAINDPGFDISQEVPISFLRAMDKLTAISEEVPILPIINRNDPQEYSVMKVMIKCGVFEDGIYDEQKKLDICKEILKQYQSIGHFIYFHQVGLEDYCILDPQWLINMIAFIVRDFKLHRFLRDFNAMSLNNGESWKSLLNEGILDGFLLRKLWLDREHEQFLTKLMLELGIFGHLFGDVKALSNAKFTVPIAMTISSDESRALSLSVLIEYLGVESLDDTMKEAIDMSSCPFNLVPFYSRLVNRLISEWYSGYNEEKNLPELLPCAANLCLGEDYKFSILINEENSTLDIFVSDHKKMNIILKYISEACFFVNAKVYQSRLELGLPAVNVRDEVILRNASNATAITTEAEIQETEKYNPNLQALIDVFEDEKFARKIHEKAEDLTPEELIQMYYSYSDREAFAKDILPELGIMQKLEQFRLIKILKSKPKPLENELYAIFNFLDENDLAVKSEEEAIRKNIRMSSYFSFAYKVLRDDKKYDKLHKALAAHRECKVVHFGMHSRSIDTFVTTTLASRLKESSVKCISLNMCKSEHIANDLRDKAKIEKVVYWLSDVRDNAARAFSDAFFYHLCVNKKENYLKFQEAFDFATENLRLLGYLLIDPANKKELEQKKKELVRPDLEAAGIPKFYDSLQEQEADQSLAAARIPGSPSANTLTRIAGTQPNTGHPMEVHRNNASEQEENRNGSVLQEEPPPSFTSTAMASTQPNNQNAFSRSDTNLSKKRRLDGNDVERNSDDAHMAYVHESPRVSNQNFGDQNQNKTSRAMKDYQSKKCQLRCNYIFTKCTSTPSHTIVSNCQYIDYHPPSKWHTKGVKSLEHDIKKCRKRGKCSSKALAKCEKCGICYCSEKKVPSKGSSVVDKSCLDVHVCTSELKDNPDITISIHRNCEECNKASENTTNTSAMAGGNEFGNAAQNYSSESGITNAQIPLNQNNGENLSTQSHLLDSVPFNPNIVDGDDNSVNLWDSWTETFHST